jgi:hypothetical protein
MYTNIFSRDLPELDKELDQGLHGLPSTQIQKKAEKLKCYDFGTTVKHNIANDYFYWFVMAELKLTIQQRQP